MRPERVGRFPKGRLEAASGTGTEWQRSGLVKYDPLTQARLNEAAGAADATRGGRGETLSSARLRSRSRRSIVLGDTPYLEISQ
jgi:hypothetical protein